jgi:hypothetical protein
MMAGRVKKQMKTVLMLSKMFDFNGISVNPQGWTVRYAVNSRLIRYNRKVCNLFESL